MDTLEAIRTRDNSQPYTTPLRVQVVDSRLMDNKLHCVVAYKTGIMKLIVDRSDLYGELSPSNYIIMRNYRKGYAYLFCTRSTTISKARSFEVPQTFLEEGNKLLPPKSRLIPIKDISDDHVQQRVSVEATIVGVSSKLVLCNNRLLKKSFSLV